MWNAISSFIQNFLGIFYQSDNDICNDHELQSWATDIHDNGLPTSEGNDSCRKTSDFKFCTQNATRSVVLSNKSFDLRINSFALLCFALICFALHCFVDPCFCIQQRGDNLNTFELYRSNSR